MKEIEVNDKTLTLCLPVNYYFERHRYLIEEVDSVTNSLCLCPNEGQMQNATNAIQLSFRALTACLIATIYTL